MGAGVVSLSGKRLRPDLLFTPQRNGRGSFVLRTVVRAGPAEGQRDFVHVVGMAEVAFCSLYARSADANSLHSVVTGPALRQG